MTFGIFKILDVLNEFQVITDVVTLDQYYLKTTDLTKMKFAAIHNEYGAQPEEDEQYCVANSSTDHKPSITK